MCAGAVSFFKDCTQNLSIIEHSGNRVKPSALYAENLNTHANVNLHACCSSLLLLAETEMKTTYTFSMIVKSIN